MIVQCLINSAKHVFAFPKRIKDNTSIKQILGFILTLPLPVQDEEGKLT